MGYIKFLGTAGARFVMIKQLRSSGGIWLSYKSTNLIIDPGPGALVRCAKAKPKLDPLSLDGVILTHKHLDHSGDINAIIEAMTEGGFRKKGFVFAPADALGREGVVFSYLKDFTKGLITLRKRKFSLGDVDFEAAVRNIHSVETYGVKFFIGSDVVSFVSDTGYFSGLAKIYNRSTVIVLNVVFYQKRKGYEHLCLDEATALIKKIRPKMAVITHFGMSMLKAKPHILEAKIRKELKCDVKFAYDGFKLKVPVSSTVKTFDRSSPRS